MLRGTSNNRVTHCVSVMLGGRGRRYVDSTAELPSATYCLNTGLGERIVYTDATQGGLLNGSQHEVTSLPLHVYYMNTGLRVRTVRTNTMQGAC